MTLVVARVIVTATALAVAAAESKDKQLGVLPSGLDLSLASVVSRDTRCFGRKKNKHDKAQDHHKASILLGVLLPRPFLTKIPIWKWRCITLTCTQSRFEITLKYAKLL